MRLATSSVLSSQDFLLESGVVLPQLDIAYETWGTLAPGGGNAILLCHGYTNHCHAGGDETGWAHKLLGLGKAIDTDRYFVVCSNMLGSSYGTTGPQSINPQTGRAYGADFPKITTRDMVGVQHLLLERLGVGHLRAVMGYSYGGHLTFLWGAMHPDRMDALVPIAGILRRENTTEQVAAIRAGFEDCPGWNGGNYQGNARDSGVFDALVAARLGRMKLYGVGRHLEDTVADPKEREQILLARATEWAEQFDANSLAILYEASIGSEADASKIKAPLLNVLSRTDSVVDVALGQPTVDRIAANGVNARFVEIDTVYGHAGPMIDAKLWQHELRAFLETLP